MYKNTTYTIKVFCFSHFYLINFKKTEILSSINIL